MSTRHHICRLVGEHSHSSYHSMVSRYVSYSTPGEGTQTLQSILLNFHSLMVPHHEGLAPLISRVFSFTTELCLSCFSCVSTWKKTSLIGVLFPHRTLYQQLICKTTKKWNYNGNNCGPSSIQQQPQPFSKSFECRSLICFMSQHMELVLKNMKGFFQLRFHKEKMHL